ncbi:hypothetical protein E2C01_016170 [Portunus trituberculatus]|uniref:Uncharacterized protein n=1 Tax=Portunus trituberculatus TaxID=210409 RepID=A0A5B7DNC8_PORTR|nr:hypothetical protein [Portunus trituberculatus]
MSAVGYSFLPQPAALPLNLEYGSQDGALSPHHHHGLGCRHACLEVPPLTGIPTGLPNTLAPRLFTARYFPSRE